MTDREKILNIMHYFYVGSFNYENEIVLAKNQCNIHTDKYNLLELYKTQIQKDAFEKIASDIEKILF